MGFGSDASLFSSVITGGVNCECTLVAVIGVDMFGRKALLIEDVVQMLITQVIIGVILQIHLKATNEIAKGVAYIVVVFTCVFQGGFAWSWGPLGWLIPSEIYPLETGSAGMFVAVCSNMLFTFFIAQAFLPMLCHMKAGIFYFFSAWIVLMGIFAVAFLPETKGKIWENRRKGAEERI